MKYDKHHTRLRSWLYQGNGEKWPDGAYHHFCSECNVEVTLLKMEGEIAAYCPQCVRWWIYNPTRDRFDAVPPPAIPSRMQLLRGI